MKRPDAHSPNVGNRIWLRPALQSSSADGHSVDYLDRSLSWSCPSHSSSSSSVASFGPEQVFGPQSESKSDPFHL